MISKFSSKQIMFRINMLRISKIGLLGLMVTLYVLSQLLFYLCVIPALITYSVIDNKIKKYKIKFDKQKIFEENMKEKQRLEEKLKNCGRNKDINRLIKQELSNQELIEDNDNMFSEKVEGITTIKQIIEETIQSAKDSKQNQYSGTNTGADNLGQTEDLGNPHKLRLTRNKPNTKYRK